MKNFIPILFVSLALTFAAEVKLHNKSILIYMLKKVVKNLICNETIPCFEGHSDFPCLANNSG